MTDDPDARRHLALCRRHVQVSTSDSPDCAVRGSESRRPSTRGQVDSEPTLIRVVVRGWRLGIAVPRIANSVGKLPVLLAGDAALNWDRWAL